MSTDKEKKNYYFQDFGRSESCCSHLTGIDRDQVKPTSLKTKQIVASGKKIYSLSVPPNSKQTRRKIFPLLSRANIL
jgi:hypothetical protein